MLTDRIDILKADGSELTGLKASVQGALVMMPARGALVEPGDLVRRHMSTGAEETFEVVEPGFYEAFGSLEAHYEMTIRRLTAGEAATAVQHITFNFSGANARVNQNSVDNSVNVDAIDPQSAQLLVELREALQHLDLASDDRQAALEIADSLQDEVASGKPKKSVVSALLAALPAVAAIADIGLKIKQLYS
jgi:hypothetical protein